MLADLMNCAYITLIISKHQCMLISMTKHDIDTTGHVFKIPVRLLGTRFTNAISYFGPGPRSLAGTFLNTL
jgi:hypothetical protein